eukprot:CAMPEP_0174828996 /NCGR_PEP_ID=MMETSP1114-20130205/1656_1 /TAXON_ID=312471 /ORGANISM="Neobodo designis, Strain CCAP 1951/1" /LENGTH=483 /DNA_ID=CAMNT_0016062729 /DNA_START=92 /DNA_END=1539 /DNA_ORIENTATION=+
MTHIDTSPAAMLRLSKKHLLLPGEEQPYEYVVVVDFEATCEADRAQQEPQEIIEFPAVLVSTREERVVDEFHRFVRPTKKPTLSTFCQQLTGITQEVVSTADEFPAVVSAFLQWLEGHGLDPNHLSGPPFIFLTHGDWDLREMLPKQMDHCDLSGKEGYDAQCLRRWINLNPLFDAACCVTPGSLPRTASGVESIAVHLQMRVEGRLHSGIDDARNIARIALALLDAGCTFPTVDEIERTPPRQHLRRLSSQHRPARGGSATTSPATQGQRPPNLSPAAAAAAKAINGGDANGESPTPFDLPPPSSVGSSSSVGGGRPLNGNAVRFTPGQQGSSSQQAAGTSSANGSNGSRNTSPSSQTQYPFSYETHGSGLFPSGPMPNGASPGRFGGGGYGHPMPPYGSGPAGGGYGGGGYGGAPMLHHHHHHHQHGYGGYGYPLHPYDPGDPYVTGMGHVPASHHGGGGGGGNGRNSRRYNHALANGYPP